MSACSAPLPIGRLHVTAALQEKIPGHIAMAGEQVPTEGARGSYDRLRRRRLLAILLERFLRPVSQPPESLPEYSQKQSTNVSDTNIQGICEICHRALVTTSVRHQKINKNSQALTLRQTPFPTMVQKNPEEPQPLGIFRQ